MPARRNRLVSAALGAALCLSATLARFDPARAATPEPGDATYHSLRYEDDFSYLANPAAASDPWDPLKYIPLGNGPYGPSYLSLGGEVRERFESYLNPNFGIRAPPSDAYLLHRLLLDADVHLTNYVRMFFQLGNFERIGDRGVTSTTDIDHLDLMQGFVDLRPPGPIDDAPVFRAGREELLFGYQRLIAVREGPNVRRDFDGFRFSDQIDRVTIDLLDVHPVNNSPAVFDDHTNVKQSLSGAYATLPLYGPLKADFYLLEYQNGVAHYRGLTGIETRQTIGTRLFGEALGFDWNNEAALQTGSFNDHAIRAGMLAVALGYTINALPWQPRIGLEANYASGDNSHGTTIGTFNAMYPRLPYFAETPLLAPANIYDVQPKLSLRPRPEILATFGWDTLWRASAGDGLYGSGMSEYTDTNKVTGSRVGTELFADIRWRIDQHLQLGAIAAEFMSGPAVQEALGRSVTFFVLFTTYRF